MVTEFSGLTSGSDPEGITLGPDGNLWFTEHSGSGSGAIGRITPSGVVTEFSAGLSIGAFPNSIVAGPDGNLWFTATTSSGGEIGRITTSGAIIEYVVPNNVILEYVSNPMGITEGLNNDLWFTDPGNHTIARITTAGLLQEFDDLTVNDAPNQIATGADGNYWFTDRNNNGDSIGQITPSGVNTLFPTPTNPSAPLGIAAGPDKNLWFVESTANQVGQVVIPQSIANPIGTPATAVATVSSSFPIATFTDNSTVTNASNFIAMIDYGDGMTGPGTILPLVTPGRYEVVGMHTYGSVGPFTATVTIGTTTGSIAPIFVGVTTTSPQTLSGLPIDGIAGRRSNTLVATFTDLDTTAVPGDFTATVTWSDNTTSTANIELVSSTSTSVQFNIYAGHTFAIPEINFNSITIVDNRNSIRSSTSFESRIAAPASSTPFNEIGPDQLTARRRLQMGSPWGLITRSGSPRPTPATSAGLTRPAT